MNAPKLGWIKVFDSHMDIFDLVDSFPDDALIELTLFRMGPTFDSKLPVTGKIAVIHSRIRYCTNVTV